MELLNNWDLEWDECPHCGSKGKQLSRKMVREVDILEFEYNFFCEECEREFQTFIPVDLEGE